MVYPLISEDECPLWGQVLYVNAGAVDAPIAVVRSNYSEYQYANSQWNLRTFPTYTLYPHWTSRGEPDLATTNLGNVLPCTNGASAPPCAQDIGWPAGMTPYMQQQYTRLAWLGSLVENKHDSGLNGGLTYRRNRYIDGKTGRFSQLDPIGLAGGLNSYGYAAGDPVSFSDPFGLCVPPGSRACQFAESMARMAPAMEQAIVGATMIGLAPVAVAAGAEVSTGGGAIAALNVARPVAGRSLLPATAGATIKLREFGERFGVSATELANRAITGGIRMLDNAEANAGNVNAIIGRLDGAAGFIRVTLDPTQSRIISAGMQTIDMVRNGIANGRFELIP